jgi:hypothetical protein
MDATQRKGTSTQTQGARSKRRQEQEGREHLETSEQRRGVGRRPGRDMGMRKDKRIVSEKKVKEEKKTYGCDTEGGDVDAEAGSMQQTGGRDRKGKSTWKRV